MNILVYALNYGAVSTDENTTDVYYIVRFLSIPSIIQGDAIFDNYIISSV